MNRTVHISSSIFVLFCSACHGFDEKGHILFENSHQGSYQVTDRNGTLDEYTLQCVECHDRHLKNPVGAGSWRHFSARLNHPVGVSYMNVSAKMPGQYNPSVTLPKEIRLFNGKIGCGTCHNIYSKERYKLSMNNVGSRLCMECHIK